MVAQRRGGGNTRGEADERLCVRVRRWERGRRVARGLGRRPQLVSELAEGGVDQRRLALVRSDYGTRIVESVGDGREDFAAELSSLLARYAVSGERVRLSVPASCQSTMHSFHFLSSIMTALPCAPPADFQVAMRTTQSTTYSLATPPTPPAALLQACLAASQSRERDVIARLPASRTVQDDEAAVSSPQRGVQVRQALQQKLQACQANTRGREESWI